MRKKFTITLDEKTIKKIKRYAFENEISSSKVIEKLIHEFVDKEGK